MKMIFITEDLSPLKNNIRAVSPNCLVKRFPLIRKISHPYNLWKQLTSLYQPIFIEYL